MPELPRVLNKKEAKITPKVIKWFEENYPHTVAVEVKVGKNKVKDHQQKAIDQVNNGVFSWKIPDMGNRSCFDFFVLKDAHGFVVTCNDNVCEAQGPVRFTFHI